MSRHSVRVCARMGGCVHACPVKCWKLYNIVLNYSEVSASYFFNMV
jgi:ferredoxin